MDKIADIVATGLSNDLKQAAWHSQNITNIHTTGYHAAQTFQQVSENQQVVEVTQRTDTSSLIARETGGELNLALLGAQFFQLDNGKGDLLLTRNGKLQRNSRGNLTHANGMSVLGQQGAIVLDDTSVEISSNGDVFQNGQVVDRIKLVSLEHGAELQPMSYGVFSLKKGQVSAAIGEVKQGMLNQSNVQADKEVVQLMMLNRHANSLQKVHLAYDQILQAVITDLGR